MTLPTSGQLSIDDLKFELRIDLPAGQGPTDFDLSQTLALLLARTKPGQAAKNYPLILPDDFYGTRRPNDPINFQQVSIPAQYKSTRNTQGTVDTGISIYKSGNAIMGRFRDKGVDLAPFVIVANIVTNIPNGSPYFDTHEIETMVEVVSGQLDAGSSPTGVWTQVTATPTFFQVIYPGPYIGSKTVTIKVNGRQIDAPANTFSKVTTLISENTFVPEITMDPGANIFRNTNALSLGEQDTYSHVVYSFVLRAGANGYGYYLWINVNGNQGNSDTYYFLAPYSTYDILQFNISGLVHGTAGSLGTGVPVGGWATRNGLTLGQWVDIQETERGVHVTCARRVNAISFAAQIRQKNTGRVFQTANLYLSAECRITDWSMPLQNFPTAIQSQTTKQMDAFAYLRIFREEGSGQILYVPQVNVGTSLNVWNWTGGSGYLAGNVPLTTRAVPVNRIRLNWGPSSNMGNPKGTGAGAGSWLIDGSGWNGAAIWNGLMQSTNGTIQGNGSFWFTDDWTGGVIQGSVGFALVATRNFTPPPPPTQVNTAMLEAALPKIWGQDGGYKSSATGWGQAIFKVQPDGQLYLQNYSNNDSSSAWRRGTVCPHHDVTISVTCGRTYGPIVNGSGKGDGVGTWLTGGTTQEGMLKQSLSHDFKAFPTKILYISSRITASSNGRPVSSKFITDATITIYDQRTGGVVWSKNVLLGAQASADEPGNNN